MTTKADLLKRLNEVDEGLKSIDQQILNRRKEGKNPTRGLQNNKLELENQREKILQELGRYTQSEQRQQRTIILGSIASAIFLLAAMVEAITGITGNSLFGVWSSMFGTPTPVQTLPESTPIPLNQIGPFQIVVCSEPNLTGKCMLLDTSIASFNNAQYGNLSNQVASICLAENTQIKVRLYQDENWHDNPNRFEMTVENCEFDLKLRDENTYDWDSLQIIPLEISPTIKPTNAFITSTLSPAITLNPAVAFESRPDSALSGWWNFDKCDGQQTNDRSGQDNHGTLTGSITFTHLSESNCTLNFLGADGQVTIRHDSSLEPITGTIEAWIKVNQLPLSRTASPTQTTTYTTTYHEFVGKNTNRLLGTNQSDGSFTGYAMRIQSDGRLHGQVATNDASGWRNVGSDASLSIQTWYYTAFTWDGKCLRFYLDGVLQQQPLTYTHILTTGLSYSGTNPLILGSAAGAYKGFRGQLDDVKIYSRALDDAEIRSNYEKSRTHYKDVFTESKEAPNILCS